MLIIHTQAYRKNSSEKPKDILKSSKATTGCGIYTFAVSHQHHARLRDDFF